MIYSPSKTEAFDFCSLKGKLMYKDKWEPREATNGTVGKISGSAFAKGAKNIHDRTDSGVDIAAAYFDSLISHYVKYGVSFSMDLGKAKDILVKALVKYGVNNPFNQWKIAATELELTDYGRCRLDVVGSDPDGYWAIADNKYKRTLNTDYLNKTVSEYRDSWQFQHYPWAYNDYISINPDHRQYKATQPVARMWLVLVIGEPFKVLSYPFFVNEKLQKRWVASAHQKWADIYAIETGERQPTLSTVHRDNYGDCPMKEACLELDLDPALMQFKYVQVPRMEE